LLRSTSKRTSPTKTTVNKLLDRHEKVLDVNGTNLAGLLRELHPTATRETAGGRINGEILDSFYAVRHCRVHCDRSKGRIDHRTKVKHECDDRCAARIPMIAAAGDGVEARRSTYSGL
jgi:integrase